MDDVEDNLFLLQTFLETEGYDVDTACDGDLALGYIRASPPDLLLLDVMMPGMNGIELMQCIRHNDKLSSLPILFITACDDERIVDLDGVDGLKIAITDFIRKPINFDLLLAKISKIFSENQVHHGPNQV
ncbi:response regulator [Brasilonema sp. UFV-L1]|uniref:response regulator n=1 Tax=Brasilonema sp. UFV-L1 TaxID=2234130 RepID=UPI0030D74250